MRGLDDLEFLILDRACRRADGEHIPYENPPKHSDRSMILLRATERLVARGLGSLHVVYHAEDHSERYRIAPTPLGRIMHRIEKLIRSGGGLRSAA